MRTTAAMTRTKVFTTATLRSPAARKCLNISAPTRHKRSESEPNPRRRAKIGAPVLDPTATQVYVHHRRNPGSVTRRSEHTNRAPSDGPNWLQVVGYFRS